ncbi:hypothetical protein EV382_2805 [Micromonospora violae]|uniref:Uncharacterized protein n=1 Tax=Micromonospora violae TaxID=1278207 RepID=A0A4Q7UJ22_9ACTN|nr:hypothetical protein EV382_2805 [Micromonospora violae]
MGWALNSHDEEADFEAGVAAAVDPQRYLQGDVSGLAVTGLHSWWNHLSCDGCGHSFRRGERVKVSVTPRAAYHADLPGECPRPAGGEASVELLDTDVAEFADGVETAWPAGHTVLRLAPGDWRVARPPAPLQRTRCLVCAHTLRVGERVVVCPCSPQRPECAATVHRDPAAGLTCWETWRPNGVVGACPITMARRAGVRP